MTRVNHPNPFTDGGGRQSLGDDVSMDPWGNHGSKASGLRVGFGDIVELVIDELPRSTVVVMEVRYKKNVVNIFLL